MKMNKIKVSVITPFHNIAPAVFKRTAASLYAAASDDWEWIIVMHNTDQITRDELLALIGNDPRAVVCEKRDRYHTPSSPRNFGLQKARGEYVYFLDGDDRLEPDFVAEASRRMEADGADIGIGRVRTEHQNEDVMMVPLPLLFPFEEGGYTVRNDPDERGNLLYGAPMMLGSKLIRRDLIERNHITFDEEITLTEDVIFMLECGIHAEKIRVYKDLTAYRYIQSSGSLLQGLISADDASEEVYLTPLRRIMSLCLTNGFSPGAYLWNMFGLFSSIYANRAIDEDKRKRLMAGIQQYLPYLSKTPPEGIGKPSEEKVRDGIFENILLDAFGQSEKETFRKYFLRQVFAEPDRTALEWRDHRTERYERFTYRELAERAIALGAALTDEEPEIKSIALVGDKSIAWVLACVTCLVFGMTVIPVDQTLDREELARRVDFCGAAAVFTDEKHRLRRDCPDGCRELALEQVPSLIERGRTTAARSDAFRGKSWRIRENDRAVMLFSSGTGGKTKCAVLSEKSLTPERYLWTGSGMDRYPCLSMLPFSHVAGFKDLIGALITGTSLLIGSGFRHLIDDFRQAEPNCVTMVPAQAAFLNRLLEGKDAREARLILGRNIRVLRLIGAPSSDTLREDFKRLGIDIQSNYGLTEACGTVSASYLKDGEIYVRPGSLGRIIPETEVRIDNPDASGNGEILVAGPIVFSGYLNDMEETGKMLENGWLKTGDIGRLDEENNLYIIGRKKNIILLSNGENVIPEEVEKEIVRIPEVRECIVYGADDLLCARIVLDPGKDFDERKARGSEALSSLWSRLPFAMRPQKIEWTDEPLPRTSSGKIRRTE